MNANKYQELANRTRWDEPGFELTPGQTMLSWNALGLAGEAGEVADMIKKGVFHQHGIDREEVRRNSATCFGMSPRFAAISVSNSAR
ncbi:MAG: hypothetical protein AAF585_20935 [Verrucomicrobiota bacterium]